MTAPVHVSEELAELDPTFFDVVTHEHDSIDDEDDADERRAA